MRNRERWRASAKFNEATSAAALKAGIHSLPPAVLRLPVKDKLC
jgi:hypothetical protein